MDLRQQLEDLIKEKNNIILRLRDADLKINQTKRDIVKTCEHAYRKEFSIDNGFHVKRYCSKCNYEFTKGEYEKYET